MSKNKVRISYPTVLTLTPSE